MGGAFTPEGIASTPCVMSFCKSVVQGDGLIVVIQCFSVLPQALIHCCPV